MRRLMILIALAGVTQEKATYIFKLGGKECGKEEVTFDKNGWKAKGAIDIPGATKLDFESSTEYGEKGARWKCIRKLPRSESAFEAEIKSRKITRKEKGNEKTRTADFPDRAILFDNLIWSDFVDIGKNLSAGERKLIKF